MYLPDAPLGRLGLPGQLGARARLEVDGDQVGVAGWIAYDDEWVEYLLTDGTWLCVEEDGGLKFSRWWDQPDPPPPGGRTIELAGRTYREVETYTAEWTAAGIEGLQGPGSVRVTDYESTTHPEYLAAIEDWGDGPELSIGRLVRPDAVIIR